MKLELPDKKLLQKTGDVDYFYWNYKFPINIFQKYRFKSIIRLLDNVKVNSLLEIGTGSGIFLPQLSKYCNELYACDIHNNYENIERLCNLYKIKNFHLSQQNIEKTSYPDNFFDVIVAVSVIEFVKDLQKAFVEIKRILKENGIFLTVCPMKSDLLDFFVSLYSTKKPKEDFINPRELIPHELERSFKIIDKGYMIPIIGRYFPVYTHYKLCKFKI
jgi:ubiquinone/menaquinone biosynthesis C-methylase UbiE